MVIQNAIKIPSGKILNSKYNHDFVESDGYFVDGGLQEHSRFGTPTPEAKYEDLSLDINSSMQKICDTLVCEHVGMLWKDIKSKAEIQSYRQNILGQYLKTADITLTAFTMNHAFLHLYVSGYWIIQRTIEGNLKK